MASSPAASRPPADEVLAAAAQLGLSLDTAQVGKLLHFLALLQRWNATYNLTAVCDPAQMLTQHLFDCLAVVEPLRRQLCTVVGKSVLDVGSGGGLPGVVLAVLEPELTVVCVDSVGKKAAFVTQVATELGLRNLRAVHSRVERMQGPGFDIVVSRAYAALCDFASTTQNLLSEAGVWMAMKGRTPLDEMESLPATIDVFHVEQLRVPGLAAERCLVWMRRCYEPTAGLQGP